MTTNVPTVTAHIASAVATAAPGADGFESGRTRRRIGERRRTHDPTTITATTATFAAAAPFTATPRGSSALPGASRASPTTTRSLPAPRPARNGTTPAATHQNHLTTGCPRRRTRASASIEAIRAGRISVAASSASAQPGITWPPTVRYARGPCGGGWRAPSSAEMIRSTDRPIAP